MKYYLNILIPLLILGCSVTRPLEKNQYNASVKHTSKEQRKKAELIQQEQIITYTDHDSVVRHIVPYIIMEDGEKLMSLKLDEVVVVARVRSIPEQLGKINLDFFVTLPKEIQGSSRYVEVTPVLHKSDKDLELEPLTIRGALFDKVQRRNYWQYDQYINVFKPDSLKAENAYKRFVKYPYPVDVRLDTVFTNKETISYFYKQTVDTKDGDKTLRITLQGKVKGLDDSIYILPTSDTLDYTISSMLNFVDTTTRYMTKIISKYVNVKDRNFLAFKVNQSDIIDTLADNALQLCHIEKLMENLLYQNEFHVDSIILTASASPEGSFYANKILSEKRAMSLKMRLSERFPIWELIQ